MPAYGFREAARYLRMPSATLTTWVKGRAYKRNGEVSFIEPLITPPGEADRSRLSFNNLIEAHVLRGFDPCISFGRPTISGTGVATRAVAARIDAGESPEEVGEDHGLSTAEVRDGMLFQLAA